jgi:mRNA interferase MazF
MKRPGQIVSFCFPQTDLEEGKLRPALLLGKLPGEQDDWLICMISSQLRHAVPDFDEIMKEGEPDFAGSGLKAASVIRIGRLAVVQGQLLLGVIGQISHQRLQRITKQLAEWLMQSSPSFSHPPQHTD